MSPRKDFSSDKLRGLGASWITQTFKVLGADHPYQLYVPGTRKMGPGKYTWVASELPQHILGGPSPYEGSWDVLPYLGLFEMKSCNKAFLKYTSIIYILKEYKLSS